MRHRGEGVRVDDAPVPSPRRLLAESFTVGVTNPKTLLLASRRAA